jgi:hypothetical protein
MHGQNNFKRLEMLLAGLKDLVKGVSKLPETMHAKRLNWNVITLTKLSIHKSVVFSSNTFNYTFKCL